MDEELLQIQQSEIVEVKKNNFIKFPIQLGACLKQIKNI